MQCLDFCCLVMFECVLFYLADLQKMVSSAVTAHTVRTVRMDGWMDGRTVNGRTEQCARRCSAVHILSLLFDAEKERIAHGNV